MQSWVSLSRTEHLQKKWRKRNGYEFAANLQVAPILIGELSQLIPHYSIAFIKEGESLQPIVLLGLGGEKNLYINDDNKWLADYVPASLRAYPFQFANSSDETIILCIEESHITDVATDSPLLTEDGELAEEVATIFEFMKNCSNNSKLTRQAAQAITDANIIEPWELRIQRAGENDAHEIKGLYKVNENALHELSDDDYIVLRKTGALILIYAHLFSLHQIAYLARRAEYLNKQSIAKIPIDMENLFEEGGNISFDTLNDN